MGSTTDWPPLWPCPSSGRLGGFLSQAQQNGLLVAVGRLDQVMPKVPSTLDPEKSGRTLYIRRLKS